MEKRTVSIPSISCSHCSNTIKRELEDMDGIKFVDADPETKKVHIHWEAPATWDAINELLNELDYPADA